MRRLLLCLLAILLWSWVAFGEEIHLDGQDEKTVTLMIYMVGSDLEAKGGAGTEDLKEMASSGVDLQAANVVVYAGGSKKWHNEHISEEQGHTLLQLEESGFVSAAMFTEASMGEPESLQEFLNYAYLHYPAEEFALILWDHGDGPMIGYGKDILYDNDSLTLAEMREALENSPFYGDNKLSWVGFDACLMSSAELACIWGDYADYLIASQEIEPAFGWDYTFLCDIARLEPVETAQSITQRYMTACEAYYEEKGYEERDTTLACMDLSQAQALEEAINALSEKALQDISQCYHQLSSARVDSRALGRASTGSEYDLVDILDLAMQLRAMYPEETAALQAVLERMIVVNATNAENLCGLSLYYPFYNKNYYEKSWAQVYESLGVLTDYADYLEAYAEVWLGSELLETVASSAMPQKISTDTFTLELTPEQAEAFADASYEILLREGDELYTRVFRSRNITKEGNTLTAVFDGQILYAKDQFNHYITPVTVEHDTVGDIARYSAYVSLINKSEDYKTEGYSFHLAVNNTTKEVVTSALVPHTQSMDTETLAGGKQADADLSEWSTYYFPHMRPQYLTRYDDGTVMPVDQWTKTSILGGSEIRVGDGLEFLFAAPTAGEYYLVFEIEDTQGSRYCSELLPIQVDGELEMNYRRKLVDVTWSEGMQVKLLEEAGVTLYLTTAENSERIGYVIGAENRNDFPVFISIEDMICNDVIYCEGTYSNLTVPEKASCQQDYVLDFGVLGQMGLLEALESIRFTANITTAADDRTMVCDQEIRVALTEKTAVLPEPYAFGYHAYKQATRGILATEQILLEKDGVTIELIGFGGDGQEDGDLTGVLRIENHTDEQRILEIKGAALDGIYIAGISGESVLPAKLATYQTIHFSREELDMHMITEPSSLLFCVDFKQTSWLPGGFSETVWCEAVLTERGSGSSFQEGSEVLFEENGIRIALKSASIPEKDAAYSDYQWYCTVVNESGEDINLCYENLKVNGAEVDRNNILDLVQGFYDTPCGAGQKTIADAFCGRNHGTEVELTFDLVVYDLPRDKILWRGTQAVTLTGKIQ